MLPYVGLFIGLFLAVLCEEEHDKIELKPIEITEEMYNASFQLQFRYHDVNMQAQEYISLEATYKEIVASLEDSKLAYETMRTEYDTLGVELKCLGSCKPFCQNNFSLNLYQLYFDCFQIVK